MRECDKVFIKTNDLLTIRDVYCKDIQYLKSNYIKQGDNTFVLNYINLLEEEINDINIELMKRGTVK